jgi:2-polyprenyl-6-hydroxyphenyl methylase/3-demethylubiquinone-9 3-methyltransferase
VTTTFLGDFLSAHVPERATCLDVGCGDGRSIGLWLRDNGRRYIGVDVSQLAVQKAKLLGLNVLQINDANSLPFESDTFDVVLCIEVLEHLFAPQVAAAEILRILRPSGVFLATVPNVTYWRRRMELALLGRWNPVGDKLSVQEPWRDPHIRFFTSSALHRMLSRAGFVDVRIGGHYGSLVRDFPLLGRLLGTSTVAQRLQQWEYTTLKPRLASVSPDLAILLLGHTLDVVARKSASL